MANAYRVDPLLRKPPEEEPTKPERLISPFLRPAATPLDLAELCFDEDRLRSDLPAANGAAAVEKGACDPNEPTAYGLAAESAASRNRLLAVLLQRSDERCEVHKGDIVAQASNSNFLLTVTSLGLTSAGTVAAAEAAKSALAAAATGITGVQAAMNEQIYQQLFVGTIVNTIDSSRAEKLKEIQAQRGLSIEAYSVDDMVRDVQEYHQRCSFYEGLVLLHETVIANRKLTKEIDSAKEQVSKPLIERASKQQPALQAAEQKVDELAAGSDAATVKAVVDSLAPVEQELQAIAKEAGALATSELQTLLSDMKTRAAKAKTSAPLMPPARALAQEVRAPLTAAQHAEKKAKVDDLEKQAGDKATSSLEQLLKDIRAELKKQQPA